MEVESAARRELLQDSTVNGYVAGKVFKYRLEEQIDGTSGRALVVSRNNGWATPDTVKSAEYPILAIKCYADPTRDSAGLITSMDATDKAFALWRVVDRLFHAKRGQRWGAFGSDPGMMVVTSRRWREPATVGSHDQHGGGGKSGGQAGDPLGDAVYVYAEYALQVIH